MKLFLKENWFKLTSILILISILLIAILILFQQKDYSPQNSTIPLQIKTESPLVQPEKVNVPQVSKTKNISNLSLNQFHDFEDYLEYILVPAQIDCNVYAVYNNVLNEKTMDDSTFKSAFPETKEFYNQTCLASYFKIMNSSKILVAEPELQALRGILSRYTSEAKEFSLYALNGGYSTQNIDYSDKKMDELRTLAREEVIRFKRAFNLE